jgi:hypothetical protein
MRRLVIYSRIIAVAAAAVLVGYLIFTNTVPFNVTRHYDAGSKDVSAIGPPARVTVSGNVTTQTDDLVYFTTKMPFRFDNAQVKVTYKNNSPSQQVLLGYKDQTAWHYNSTTLDESVINNLNWSKIGSGPYLFQKSPTYSSVQQFINNPPKTKAIGVYDYSNNDLLKLSTTPLPNYQPTKTDTTINVPLRGSTTFYAYLNNEPFHMSFTKQDLNWYDDPDVMKVSVYKDKLKVFDATIDDDGDSSNDHQPGPSQTFQINNPGPGLPQAGVYKIVVEASDDTVLTKITTNLHKIAFEGPIYPVANATIYSGLVSKTQATDLYTRAPVVTAQTYHASTLQTISVGGQSINLTKPLQTVATKVIASVELAKIEAPKSDVSINGAGYFAFSPDQFFEPSSYKTLPINSAQDLSQVDYVLTDYPGIEKLPGGWQVAQRDFDLSDAVIQKGQLSWVIDAPGLSNNGNKLQIKSIEVTLSKKGWLGH